MDMACHPHLKNIERITEYLNYFLDPDNKFYTLNEDPKVKNSYIYTFTTLEFVNALKQENILLPFPWQQWTSQARHYFNNSKLIAEADLKTIQKLLTVLIQMDHLSGGVLAHAIDKGLIIELLKRLQQLLFAMRNQFQGCFLGLAIGDALGMPLEFKDPGSFKPIQYMEGGGSFNLKKGEWTDDTSMALLLAESLIEMEEFNPTDQLDRYLRWYEYGYLSVKHYCFDIGNTTKEALNIYRNNRQEYPGPDHELSASNGSLMRLAPIPMFFLAQPEQVIYKSELSSRTTHNHPLAVDGCRYLGGLILGALYGYSKEDILSPFFSVIPHFWEENPLSPEIAEVAAGSFKEKEPPEIRGRSYVPKSLEAALWAFYNSDNFREGCLLAVNLGEDTDTTGAIYGQLAGAYYGLSSIPSDWVNSLAWLDFIMKTVDSLEIAADHWNQRECLEK